MTVPFCLNGRTSKASLYPIFCENSILRNFMFTLICDDNLKKKAINVFSHWLEAMKNISCIKKKEIHYVFLSIVNSLHYPIARIYFQSWLLDRYADAQEIKLINEVCFTLEPILTNLCKLHQCFHFRSPKWDFHIIMESAEGVTANMNSTMLYWEPWSDHYL